MTKAKGGGGEGLYVTGISGQRDMEQGKGMKIRYSILEVMGGFGASAESMTMVMYCWEMAGNAVEGGRRRKQLGEYQFGLKIKTANVLDSCNQGPTQQCINSGVAKGLAIVGIHFHNRLVEEINMTLLAKVELKEDHTFKVEPQGNVDHVVGSYDSEDINEGSSKGKVPKEDINEGPLKRKFPPLGSSARPRPEVCPELENPFKYGPLLDLLCWYQAISTTKHHPLDPYSNASAIKKFPSPSPEKFIKFAVKMMKSKGDGGEGLYVTGISGQRDIERGKGSAWSRNEGMKIRYLILEVMGGSRASADVMMVMSVEQLLDWM
uniref:Uncharacterized protein n=1 Tax=Tanacetum cinerariifolium TaxID=118510 RepID=A0A6L2L879_TANCI|nr:hypothetical protein [Tanacetum cinerariifolium]